MHDNTQPLVFDLILSSNNDEKVANFIESDLEVTTEDKINTAKTIGNFIYSYKKKSPEQSNQDRHTDGLPALRIRRSRHEAARAGYRHGQPARRQAGGEGRTDPGRQRQSHPLPANSKSRRDHFNLGSQRGARQGH